MFGNLPFKESDLWSFGGLAVIIPMLMSGIKFFLPKLVAGREPMIVLVLTYVLGFAAKFTLKGVAFTGVSPLGLAVGLFFVALAAAQVHDTFINKVLKGQDGTSTTPPLGGGTNQKQGGAP